MNGDDIKQTGFLHLPKELLGVDKRMAAEFGENWRELTRERYRPILDPDVAVGRRRPANKAKPVAAQPPPEPDPAA